MPRDLCPKDLVSAMKSLLFKRIFLNRYLLAAIAGLVLAAAFPKLSVAGFAWIAPGLILFCGIGQTGRQKFWIGFAAGVAHFLVSLYWLLSIPFPAGAVAGWLALSAYLSLYPAVWVWLCWRVFSRLVTESEPALVQADSDSRGAEIFLRTTWKQRAVWAIACAAIWVALEMVMARMFSGFPWNFLGITQYKILPLIQISSFTGVYGVSFLLVWFAVSLCTTGCLLVQKPQSSRVWFAEIAVPGIVVALVFNFGLNQFKRNDPPARQLKVALVQPSIPQTLIFDPSQGDTRFERLIELSEKALAEKPDVLIWPEASMPPLDEAKFSTITNLIVTHHVWMIFGADDAAIREAPGGGLETNYFNSSFLFAPGGRAVATYRKRRLVIFGEYVPLVRWLPFMKWLTPIDGGFTPGEGPVPFQIESPRARTTTLICFEDAFPQYVREHVETDTDFLLNLTNDGWFGNGAAQWQQAVNAAFRAVENGLPMVRCTNNGLTCWIDKFGRLRKFYSDETGDVYSRGFLIAEIPLLPLGEKREPTFYRLHGDWFGWSCVTAAVALCFLSRKSRVVTKST